MSDEKTSLTAALRHLAEQERKNPSEHATPGELTAYHEGTLPPPVEARVREHLAHCKLCSDLLLDLAGFADLAPPPGVPELTEAEVEEDWQALRRKLGEERDKPPIEEKPAGEVVPLRRPSAPSKPDREFSLWQVVAAAAILTSIGLSIWVGQLKREIGQLSQIKIVTAIDMGNTKRSGDTETPKISSRDGGVVYLDPAPDESYSKYDAEILQGDKVIVRIPVGEIETTALLMIPRGSLEPGSYVVRLYGIEGGQREPSSDLEFEVDGP